LNLVFTLLEGDRVHHRLTLGALQPGLDHRPLAGVDDQRDLGDVRFAGDQVEEVHHRLLGVEHALVHVDVDHLGAVRHLITGDHQGGVVVAVFDQLGELGRAGDVGPFADVDEQTFGADVQGLEAGDPKLLLRHRRSPRGQARHRLGDGLDVGWRGAAAAAHQVQVPRLGELPEQRRHDLRRLIVAAEGVGQAGVGVGAGVAVGDPREFGDVGPQLAGAQGAVEAHQQGRAVAERVIEGLGGLAGQGAARSVGDGAGDHDRQLDPVGVEVLADREEGGFGVEGVEDGLDHQEVGATFDQAPELFVVGLHQLIEGDVAEARVVDVGGKGGGPVGRPEHPRDEAGLFRILLSILIGHRPGHPGRLQVELVGQALQLVVVLCDPGGAEGVGLDDVGAGLEVRGVDLGHHLGFGHRQDVVVAPQIAGVVGAAVAAKVGLFQATALQHGAHGAV
jgi:hypothetical protein